MLVIKCAGCHKKLFRYDKIGHGAVLRCYRAKITRDFSMEIRDEQLICRCGKIIARDKGRYFDMIKNAFTWSGTKRSG